jgi:hypothetical protein
LRPSPEAAPAVEALTGAPTESSDSRKKELELAPRQPDSSDQNDAAALGGVVAEASSPVVQHERVEAPAPAPAVPTEGEGGAPRSVAPVADTVPDVSHGPPKPSVEERPIVGPPRVETAAVSAESPQPDSESAIVPTRPFTPREYRAPERPRPFEVPPGVEFNGDLLRQVRMARGLSLLQLSERTRIGVRHLENLEGDRYDALPALVYLRGMLMNMARELGLDGLRVSKSYLTFVEAHQAKAKG